MVEVWIPGLPGEALDHPDQGLDGGQVAGVDEAVIAVGRITAQPAEPGILAAALTVEIRVSHWRDLDAEVVVTGEHAPLAVVLDEGVSQPGEPVLVRLAVQLVPFEPDGPQPSFGNRALMRALVVSGRNAHVPAVSFAHASPVTLAYNRLHADGAPERALSAVLLLRRQRRTAARAC